MQQLNNSFILICLQFLSLPSLPLSRTLTHTLSLSVTLAFTFGSLSGCEFWPAVFFVGCCVSFSVPCALWEVKKFEINCCACCSFDSLLLRFPFPFLYLYLFTIPFPCLLPRSGALFFVLCHNLHTQIAGSLGPERDREREIAVHVAWRWWWSLAVIF